MPVDLTDPALDDLRRLGPPPGAPSRSSRSRCSPRTRTRATRWSPAPGTGSSSGANGAWRVVYRALDAADVTVWEVWVDGVRSDGAAYAEALHRMQAADTPEVVGARAPARAARPLTGTVPLPPARLREPVPDWLADALSTRPRRSRWPPGRAPPSTLDALEGGSTNGDRLARIATDAALRPLETAD